MPTEVLVLQDHVTRLTKGGPVHKFTTNNGKTLDTFDADLATRASSLMLQDVSVTYDEQQNGQYTNYKLVSIAGGSPEALAQGATNGHSAGEQKSAVASGSSKPSQAYWDEKDQRITRSFGVNAALKALEIAGGDYEAAKILLTQATELAPIAAVYSWAGKK